MNFNNFLVVSIITIITILLIYKLYYETLLPIENTIIIFIFGFIISLVFSNAKNIISIIKKKNIYNFLAILFAFIGSFLWFIGEYLVNTGREKHSLLDPIGAFFSSFSALITLIVFLHH